MNTEYNLESVIRIIDSEIVPETFKQKYKTMTNFKTELEKYKSWISQQDWYQENLKEDYVIIKDAPTQLEIDLLIAKFGNLPQKYVETLNNFGLSAYWCDCNLTKMLSPSEIIEMYEIVQNEMDFNDGLREELLAENDFDYSKYIPVMSGEGIDGRWALLNIDKNSKGEILLWDTNQAGYIDDVFENLEIFINTSIARARDNNPLRLT